jgi:CheY-like chemotaxis protein
MAARPARGSIRNAQMDTDLPNDTTADGAGRRQKILVVNDSPEFLAMMREVLADEGGYEVATLDKSEGVVREATARPPHLLIIDILFREGRVGLAIAEELAAAADTARIPVLFCTALARSNISDDVWELIQQRQHQVLFKPFDLDDLLRVVGDLLAGHNRASSPLEVAGS